MSAEGRGLGPWFAVDDGAVARSSEVDFRILFEDPRRAVGGAEVYLTSTNGTGWGLEGFIHWRAGQPPAFKVWNRDEARPGERLDELADYTDKVTRIGAVLYSLRVVTRTTRLDTGDWLDDVWVHGKPGWKCVDKVQTAHAARRVGGDNWGPVVELIGAQWGGLGVVGFERATLRRDDVTKPLGPGNTAWRWQEVGIERRWHASPGEYLLSARRP